MAAGPAQALTASTVILVGAGSQIGLFALRGLLAEGCKVLAVSRSGLRPGLEKLKNVHWLDEQQAAQSLASCQYLLSAGPLDVARRILSSGDGPKSIVAFSSTSTETKHDSADAGERAVAASLMEQEEALQSIVTEQGARLVIFRPTLVYGCGLDANISRLARWVERYGFLPISGRATGLRMPVHAEDLATVALRALFSEAELPSRLTVAGGETLSYAEMARRIFHALEKPERLLRVPEWLFVSLARLIQLFKPGAGVNPEMVRRQAVDLVFDDSETRRLLSYAPRPFKPGRADFSLPGF